MSTLTRMLRLYPKCQFGKVLGNGQLGMLQVVRPITMRVEQAKPVIKTDHDDKNMNLKRPMSPHLTIYAPELQSFMSITHRAMGMAMSTYLIGFGIGTIALPQDISTYIAALDAMNIPSPILFAGRFLVVLPFTYHAINGIRHLIWDMGRLLYIKQVISSGYVVLGIALLLAGALAS
ncbi:succinate dehydrogenase cytochrome b560 subunit, mitochondrial-like [Coccinella septempunctata]|uniref:succinate dehydrogenase cytochrome b560 subunit, mitochondrial-like n=1 Tax=Coccinella septempunctata TaxID=41139 RepID=UPI001D0976EC|nr:succinate dehydrogenase cytochrome b560 subunit, mitochondrial-like [Coccinella septempunctata]